MKHHRYEGKPPKESGTRSDVKGVHKSDQKDGRHPHMRHSHHEMGEYKEGEHFHHHSRDKD